jgi:hypothetical protein
MCQWLTEHRTADASLPNIERRASKGFSYREMAQRCTLTPAAGARRTHGALVLLEAGPESTMSDLESHGLDLHPCRLIRPFKDILPACSMEDAPRHGAYSAVEIGPFLTLLF